jgi:hypothetical protein
MWPLQDVRRVEDPFKLAVEVAGTVFVKGLTNNGVGIKSSSNYLIHSFSLAFSTSIPPMESLRASAVAR